MEIPEHGSLQELNLHGRFVFKSLKAIPWESTETNSVILYLPLGAQEQFAQECVSRYHKIHCDMEFKEENREVLLEGKILKLVGLSVEIETDGKSEQVLLVELTPKDSLRFTNLVSDGTTQIVPQQPRRRREDVVRTQRKHHRLPKKYKTVYTVNIPVLGTKASGLSCPVLETFKLCGESKDISEDGIFVRSEFLPPINARIKLQLFTNKGQVEMKGKVVRRETKPGESGFALQIFKEDIIEKEIYNQFLGKK